MIVEPRIADRPTRVLVTGAEGFIGRNTVVRLRESPDWRVDTFCKHDRPSELPALIAQADAVIHLAGANRPADDAEFARVNTELTGVICELIRDELTTKQRSVPLVFASSVQAEQDNPYGRSKLAAENVIETLAAETQNPCVILRPPGVFGKWCRPHYNSVVATFCHQLARHLPIEIHDANARIRLVYIDDVVSMMIDAISRPSAGCVRVSVDPEYQISLGELAAQIQAFAESRTTLLSERVGVGLTRALYATYVSYLPPEEFAYSIPIHSDSRGVFVEMLKTRDSGQFSYFTAHPGVTRGGHYHHSKTEKFLVIRGEALFRFRDLATDELVERRASGDRPEVVETIPGWVHDVTNVGTDEMVVMLWANEVFDPMHPDTIPSKV